MPSRKFILLTGGTLATGAALAFWPWDAKTSVTPAPVAHTQAAALDAKPASQVLPTIELALADALQQGVVQAEFKGNGKDKLVITARNAGTEPVRLKLSAGQFFTADHSTVALLRSRQLEIAPGAAATEELRTAAIQSGNAVVETAYTLSTTTLPKLASLFAHLDAHTEVSTASAQTAVLALTENLPLSAFAKFTLPTGGVAPTTDTQNFKTDTSDIIGALAALRELGLEGNLALTIDPQLRIESMIDPLAHAMAVRYYGISDEWAYWKQELLQGNDSTRHYALYGIARFYPDVALQMLPKWAREAKTSPVYRISAVQALAETQRPEAVTVLRQLEHEFGTASELGKAAQTAANFLDAQFSKTPKVAVAFRASKQAAQAQ